MPNWCSTTYKCVGDPKQIGEFHDALKKLQTQEEPYVENGFGKLWLGCVINFLGGDWEEENRCRGEITDYDLDGNILTLYQQTAWNEQEGFRHFIEKRFPSIKVYYQEEECGNDVYYTNDDTGHYFPDKYFLDSYEPEDNYFQNFDDLAKKIQEITGKYVSTEEEAFDAIENFMNEHEDDDDVFYSLHKFRYCEN